MSEVRGVASIATVNGKMRMPAFSLVRRDWLARAALLPGRTLHFAFAVFMFASIANSATVTIGGKKLTRYGVTRDAAGDALGRLIEAGLVKADRGRGRESRITLLDRNGEALRLNPTEEPS